MLTKPIQLQLIRMELTDIINNIYENPHYIRVDIQEFKGMTMITAMNNYIKGWQDYFSDYFKTHISDQFNIVWSNDE